VVMVQVALVLQMGSPPRSRQVGVAAVKNSRRLGLFNAHARGFNPPPLGGAFRLPSGDT